MTEYYIDVDMYASWKKLPVYRIWLNNELMCERTFWPNPETYIIRERLMVDLAPGRYTMTIELVDPSLGKAWAKRIRIIEMTSDHVIQDHVPSDMSENKQSFMFLIQ